MSNDGFERPDPIGEPGRSGGSRFPHRGNRPCSYWAWAWCWSAQAGAYWVSQNEALREGFGAIAESQNAPGAEELRAAGCDQALILDPTVFLRMAAGFSESMADLDDPEIAEKFPETMIVCNTTSNTSITCADVATTYLAAVGPITGEFMAQVASGGADPCQEIYDGSGTLLGTLDEWVSEAEAEESPAP